MKGGGGESSNTSSCSCYRSQVKLPPCGPLRVEHNLTLFLPQKHTGLKVPLRRKFFIPFSLQLLKVEVINTYHVKFYIEIPTGRPVILNVKFSSVLPPLLDSKNGREPHRELDLVAPRGI